MSQENSNLPRLRQVITENLRVQRGGGETPPYIDVSNALPDVKARQNHVVFARRGCGKTLLLHYSASQLDQSIRSVYLNCEDFKHHSFPNVLVEILDALFRELEGHLTGWFGKKKRSRELIQGIRKELAALRTAADVLEEAIQRTSSRENTSSGEISSKLSAGGAELRAAGTVGKKSREETQRTCIVHSDKLRELDMWLPRLKGQVREFFQMSTTVKAIFLQIDDLYHLRRSDQPFVVDYIHRLCKDLPLYFKIATLRHASALYADREGQPIGAQERHDYQPINIDYTFGDFRRTRDQNRQILEEFARMAGMSPSDVSGLFKGEGFDRLVMAGGGVPRDTLSLFLEVLGTVQVQGGDRIGKDEVRILSRSNFERRIEELKQDSEGGEQDTLMRGIYVLREFCLRKATNVFMVSEQMLQQRDEVRGLINRLLDYRIIHNAGAALTHKSQPGTYQAFAIDIGCYAHLRKLDGRFNELDLSGTDAKEGMRSAPVLDAGEFKVLWNAAPNDVEDALLSDPTDA
jgi:Cdc6-like AAA superfamily ATPase